MGNLFDPSSLGDDVDGPGMFGASLEELLERDFGEDLAGDHSVPRVLVHLIKQIEVTGGLETEGIFRLSVTTDAKKMAMAALHAGLLDSTSPDPHLYCVLLKEWFRRLPSPLVPSYDKCITLAKCTDKASQEELLEEIWSDTSIPAKAVLRKVFDFIEAAVLHEKTTRMNDSSLCLVFAPGILRPAVEQSALDMLRDQPLSQKALLMIYEWVRHRKQQEEDVADLSGIY